MMVKHLLWKQKYYTPIEICGGKTPKEFFSKRFDRFEREDAIKEFGDKEVHYFYYATDYENFKKLPYRLHHLFNKLFHKINPQVLRIELY